MIQQRYEKAGIELITNRQIVEITPSEVVLDNSERIRYTVLAILELNRAPRFVAEAGLGDQWMEVRSPTDLRPPSTTTCTRPAT